MATPTLGTINLTAIDRAELTTGWVGTSLDVDPDLYKEGNNSVYGLLRTDLDTFYYDDGTAPVTAVNKHVRIWINFSGYVYLDTEANGGMELLAYDGTTTEYITVFGSDSYAGGWFNLVFDMNQFTTLTLANVQRWGFRFNRTAAPKNVDNTWVDFIRYMDGYYVTGGTSGDKIRLAGIAIEDANTTNGYGIVLVNEGVFFGYGQLQLGNGATTTFFEMDGDVLSFADAPVASNFFKVSGNGTGADILIKDSVIQSAGITDDNRFVFDMSSTDISFEMTGTVLQRAAAVTFASGQTVESNTFNDCGQITHAGSSMIGSNVKNYEGTVGTGALLYNVALDPDGEMDGMEFTKGTAATHAIQFGTSAPNTMTLRDISFISYNAADGNNDSTLYFPDKGTDTTWTINLIGCSGNISYRKARAGDTVNLIIDPVTTSLTVKNTAGSNIENARALVWVTDNSNYFYQASVTITGTGTTATVSHTAHGMTTGDNVIIRGVTNDDTYNGAYTVTVLNVNSYSYTTNETISIGTASGTITSTFAVLNGLTSAAGYISDNRSWTADQDILGWVRKSSSSPYYVQSNVTGTIDTEFGFNATLQMISDE